jgi:hypothetical protein
VVAAGRARTAARARRLLESVRPARLLLALGAPTLVTVATAWLGWWDPGNVLRASSAVPLGLAAGLIVTAGVSRDLR